MAGDHQGAASAVEHHQRCIHATHPVSTRFSLSTRSPPARELCANQTEHGAWIKGGGEGRGRVRGKQTQGTIKHRQTDQGTIDLSADLLPTLPASFSPLPLFRSFSLLLPLLSALLVCFAFVTFRIYTLIHVKRQDDNLCAMCFPCTQSASSLPLTSSLLLSSSTFLFINNLMHLSDT